MPLRYLLLWLPMTVIGVLNGILRETTYGKRLPELRAHQLSTLIGAAFIGLYVWFVTGRWPLESGHRRRPQGSSGWRSQSPLSSFLDAASITIPGAACCGITICAPAASGASSSSGWRSPPILAFACMPRRDEERGDVLCYRCASPTPTWRHMGRTGQTEQCGSVPVQICLPNGTSRRLISTRYLGGRTVSSAIIVFSGVLAAT